MSKDLRRPLLAALLLCFGCSEAQFQIGKLYEHGKLVDQDPAHALVWYEKAAEKGHRRSLYFLAVAHNHGIGVPVDPEEAARYFRLAADRNHSDSQVQLGWLYQHGRGIAQDDEQAVHWYRAAAQLGHFEAQSNLGWMYEHGRGVEQDDELAVAWYRKAAERDLSVAQTNLASMYERGRGVPQDLQQARDWYERAAEDYTPAQNGLAWLLATQAEATAEDLDRALGLALEARASEPDSPAVADTLGWVLVKRGTPREAVAHLHFAAEQALRGGNAAQAAGSRFRLAFALNQLGRVQEAAALARQALGTSAAFAERARAEQLLKTLATPAG